VLNERETAEDPARSQIVDYAARFGVIFELGGELVPPVTA